MFFPICLSSVFLCRNQVQVDGDGREMEDIIKKT
jgi:hypothetical protein